MNRLKKSAKSALCATYFYSGAAHAQEWLQRRAGRQFMTILLFHRVTDQIPKDGLTVSAARFRAICEMLRRGFRVVPLAEIFDVVRSGRAMPPRTVAVTFDDCYRDNLFAARVLAEHSLPATFFVPTAFVGTDRVFPWDSHLPCMPNLTWDDVREMVRMGHEIGSHTATHINLGTASQDDVRAELVESKAELEKQLERKARWFAYPYGGLNDIRPETAALVQEAGYEGCLSGYGGFVYPGADPRILPRDSSPVYQEMLNVQLHLRGCLEWFYQMKRSLGLPDGVESGAREPQLPVPMDNSVASHSHCNRRVVARLQ